MFNDRSPFETSTSNPTPQRGGGSQFQFRRKILKLRGHAFYVHDSTGAVVLYADQKAFKLKEDIRIYTGDDRRTEVIRIAARSILDFSAAYDIYDTPTQTKVGVLRRRGMKSILRDEWQILDAQDRELGLIQEDSNVLALLRRFVDFASLLFPQKYTLTVGNQIVGSMTHVFNPFSSKINADFSADPNGLLDRRVALAAGVLMCAIEGRQHQL